MSGCNCEWVQPGELGRVKTTSGWNDDLLKPGRHSVGWNGTLYTMDATENTFTESMNILMKDQINLSLSLQIRCGVDVAKSKEVLSVFDRVKAGTNPNVGGTPPAGQIKKTHITLNAMYKIYAQMLMQSVPRATLSPLTVEEFRDQRADLSKLIDKKIREALASTPLKAYEIQVTNIDWPAIITRANEAAKEREIEIKAEEAKVQKELVRAQGEQKIAEERYKVQMLEAKMIADANRLISDSLKDNPEFLQWHTVKFLSEAAKGPNNAFLIIPYQALGGEKGHVLTPALLRQLLEDKKPAQPVKKETEEKK
jgi:hypothetical protein